MTRLVYLDQMQRTELDAHVVRLEEADADVALFLDQTVFYPQGGGQPSDTGVIESPSARFEVRQVRWRENEVAHLGAFEKGSFAPGEAVRCIVDQSRRSLHTRIHSAGHVVDMAVDRLGYGWKPGKGYHFPEGPYVEYVGELAGDKELVRAALESSANEVVAENASTRLEQMTRDELARVVRYVPDYVAAGEASRVVFYGNFGVPCGGTHVAQVGEIGRVTIRKIKGGSGLVRVSYAVL